MRLDYPRKSGDLFFLTMIALDRHVYQPGRNSFILWDSLSVSGKLGFAGYYSDRDDDSDVSVERCVLLSGHSFQRSDCSRRLGCSLSTARFPAFSRTRTVPAATPASGSVSNRRSNDDWPRPGSTRSLRHVAGPHERPGNPDAHSQLRRQLYDGKLPGGP